MYVKDTIAAVATPPGRGGVGIIRLSGKDAQSIATAITHKVPCSHQALFCQFFDNGDEIIDFGYVIYFKAPRSFTGEDVLELQGHGGPVVMDLLLKRAVECGARLAEPGEFSKRAFLNDKMDLVQAEAVSDLIAASNETSARLAQRSLQGRFSKEVNLLLEALIGLRVYVEAALDFPEEEIDFLSDTRVINDLEHLAETVKQLLINARQGAVIREGLEVVIAGKPNAGKSTLINQLSGQETAIVTDIPGTTRDVVREQIIIDDLPLHLVDTAGLRESNDIVELEGIKRARKAVLNADLVLLMIDGSRPYDIHTELSNVETASVKKTITIINKADLINTTSLEKTEGPVVSLSAKTGDGIDKLKALIKSKAGLTKSIEEGAFMARRRHVDALEQAQSSLKQGFTNLEEYKAGELLAEDLRDAQKALGEITGDFSADDLLGEIFSSFCIGK